MESYTKTPNSSYDFFCNTKIIVWQKISRYKLIVEGSECGLEMILTIAK